jgi:hypothetical protein
VRSTLPISIVVFLSVGVLPAQQNADSRLATIAHLAALTESDLNDLLSQAQSDDREAQYWVGQVYEEGRLIPKSYAVSREWMLKSAEQGYAPAQEIVGRMYMGATGDYGKAVAVTGYVFDLAVHDCRKQLLCNPYDEGQFLIFIVSSNLPTSERWQVKSDHHVWQLPEHALRPNWRERSGLSVQPSAGDRQPRPKVWFCTPVKALSPPSHFLSECWVGRSVVTQPSPRSVWRGRDPQSVRSKPKPARIRFLGIRPRRYERLI